MFHLPTRCISNNVCLSKGGHWGQMVLYQKERNTAPSARSQYQVLIRVRAHLFVVICIGEGFGSSVFVCLRKQLRPCVCLFAFFVSVCKRHCKHLYASPLKWTLCISMAACHNLLGACCQPPAASGQSSRPGIVCALNLGQQPRQMIPTLTPLPLTPNACCDACTPTTREFTQERFLMLRDRLQQTSVERPLTEDESESLTLGTAFSLPHLSLFSQAARPLRSRHTHTCHDAP